MADPEDYDDTDMTPEEFDSRMRAALPAGISNLGDLTWVRVVETGSSNTTTTGYWTFRRG